MSGRLDRIPGVVLVSLAAAMWGLDGLIRKPLADSTSAYTIVFGEHVALVLVTLPLLVPVVIGAARASAPLLATGASGSPSGRWLLTLALYDLLFGLIAYALFDFLVED